MLTKILQGTQRISLPLNQYLTTNNHILRTFTGRRNRLRKPESKSTKEHFYGAAGSDDKFVKLTKKEDEEQRIAREKKEELKRESDRELIKRFDLRTSIVIDEEVLKDIEDVKKRTKVDLISNPLQGYELVKASLEKLNTERVSEYEKNPEKMPEYKKTSFPADVSLNTLPMKPSPKIKNRKKYEQEFYNTEFEINEKFYDQVQMYTPQEDSDKKRVGLLSWKVGMTHVWDKWGVAIPLTVLQVDRCQVTQIKAFHNGKYAMQIGFGEKSLRRIRKSMVGH